MYRNKIEKSRIQTLENIIHQKECELQRHYSQLGKSLLATAEGEQRIINRLVDELIEARAELVEFKGQQECPSCTAYNDADSCYCKRCGTSLNTQPTEKEI